MGKSSDPNDAAASHLACQHVVHTLVEKYEWALLPEAELVELVLTAVPTETLPTNLEKLARNQYTRVMYEACRQTTDLGRRERAFQELFRFLYRAAYNYWPDLVEVVTQRALMLVYQQLDHCYNPGTFLGFAFNKLRQAVTEELRARKKMDLSLDEIQPDKIEVESPQTPFSQVEQLQVLIEAIKNLRNEREQKVILWKFFDGLSDEEIAERLGITASYVLKLRYDGLARLRQDSQLRDYYFGL